MNEEELIQIINTVIQRASELKELTREEAIVWMLSKLDV